MFDIYFDIFYLVHARTWKINKFSLHALAFTFNPLLRKVVKWSDTL